jgi:hypothetical protein
MERGVPVRQYLRPIRGEQCKRAFNRNSGVECIQVLVQREGAAQVGVGLAGAFQLRAQFRTFICPGFEQSTGVLAECIQTFLASLCSQADLFDPVINLLEIERHASPLELEHLSEIVQVNQ